MSANNIVFFWNFHHNSSPMHKIRNARNCEFLMPLCLLACFYNHACFLAGVSLWINKRWPQSRDQPLLLVFPLIAGNHSCNDAVIIGLVMELDTVCSIMRTHSWNHSRKYNYVHARQRVLSSLVMSIYNDNQLMHEAINSSNVTPLSQWMSCWRVM